VKAIFFAPCVLVVLSYFLSVFFEFTFDYFCFVAFKFLPSMFLATAGVSLVPFEGAMGVWLLTSARQLVSSS
jgi:hypothetical protein